MAAYIGLVGGKFYHTYSKTLRDKYFRKTYVVIYTVGTGKNGVTKFRGSAPLSELEKRVKNGEYRDMAKYIPENECESYCSACNDSEIKKTKKGMSLLFCNKFAMYCFKAIPICNPKHWSNLP